MLKKTEGIGIIVAIAITICFFAFRCWNTEHQINIHRVYVIGKLVRSSFEGSENGWIYDFEYMYNNKRFIRSFSGPIGETILADSLIFLKIDSTHPALCRQLLEIPVPKCINFNNMPTAGWQELPACN